jgi:hypothetical protein
MSLFTILIVVALILAILAAIPIPSRINLLASAFAFYMLALLVGGQAFRLH